MNKYNYYRSLKQCINIIMGVKSKNYFNDIDEFFLITV